MNSKIRKILQCLPDWKGIPNPKRTCQNISWLFFMNFESFSSNWGFDKKAQKGGFKLLMRN
jgi:hypothetical protein